MKSLLAIAMLLPLLGACDWFGAASKPAPLPGERIAVMQFEASLKPAPELAGEPIAVPEPRVNQDWPQPFGSAAHVAGHLQFADAPKRLWSASIGHGSDSERKLLGQPIVGDGVVYAMDSEGYVSAHRLDNGSRLWSQDITPDDESDGTLGAGLAYADGKLYATTGFAEVVSLDAKTGKELWRRKVSGPVRGAPAVASGRVFVICIDNTSYALSADDGRVLWNHSGTTEGASLLGAATPAVADDVVVIAYSSGELFGLRAANGRQIWADFLSLPRRISAVSDLNDIRASPVIEKGRVYAVGNAGRMVSIVLNTGARAWDQRISGVQTPWLAGEVIYVLNTDNELICLSSGDGRVRWIRQLPRYEDEAKKEDPIDWVGPVLAGDRLVLGGSHGVAISVSPYTGEILGQSDLPDPVVIPPIVAQNTLIFVTDEGDLVAYR
ncbi:MAG TPA: PQQ-binding-like beta-propeller repeat protein [Alphaproteobacteria bacterium]